MKRFVLVSSLLFVLGAAGNALAQRPHGLFFRTQTIFARHTHAAPSYDETRAYLNCRYPKYIHGFHASYFRDMGVPSGDIGFRGNGLYVTPW